MKNMLVIAALALGISGTAANAQRAISPIEIAPAQVSNPIEGNLIEVHRKHKKYKRYSKKHYKKHHRNKRYAYKKHKRKHYKRHRHLRYYGHHHHGGSTGRLVIGNAGIYIRIF